MNMGRRLSWIYRALAYVVFLIGFMVSIFLSAPLNPTTFQSEFNPVAFLMLILGNLILALVLYSIGVAIELLVDLVENTGAFATWFWERKNK